MSEMIKTLFIKDDVAAEIVEQSYCTNYLTSLFASFLTGGATSMMYIQKYFEIHRGKAEDLRAAYERGDSLPNPLIPRFPIRVSSTSVSDGVHYATFSATYRQGEGGILTLEESAKDLTIVLTAGNNFLALAPFDIKIYRDICNGARVDIKWKLQLRDLSNILGVREEYNYGNS